MALIDRKWFLVHILFGSGCQPLPIIPFKMVQIIYTGSCSRSQLCIICIRICFVELSSICKLYQIFVHLSFLYAFDKCSIDTTFTDSLHFVGSFIPAVEFTNHINILCIRRPYSEKSTLFSIVRAQMCSKFLIDLIMRSLSKYILICLGNKHFLCLLFFFAHAHTPFHLN